MRIMSMHPNFVMPIKSTDGAGAFDIYMTEPGSVNGHTATKVALGFSAEVPANHVALILPRSGIGAKHGLELNNTCGVIDSDYRHEWFASVKLKSEGQLSWNAGDRLLQFLIVPVADVQLELASELTTTERKGGFGSTGK